MSADLQKLEEFLTETIAQVRYSNEIQDLVFSLERKGEGLILKSRFTDVAGSLAEIGPEELAFMQQHGCYEVVGDNLRINWTDALSVVQKARQAPSVP
jgi:hypothetical protein